MRPSALTELLEDRLWRRAWLLPGLGAALYLAGVNDEVLHVFGDWWLSLNRWIQTVVVLLLLTTIASVVAFVFSRRRSAYNAAVRAAESTRAPAR